MFAANEAGAMGGGGNPAFMMPNSGPTAYTPQFWSPPPQAPVFERRERYERRTVKRERKAVQTGQAVCVRLCDGSYFPSATASGGDAACQAQCPDAPMALYTQPSSSDRIEDAVSTRGTLYSALPVSGRYRSVADNACVCHREPPNYMAMVMSDPTLRKGDAVMTPGGIVVYQGANERAARPADFVALARASRVAGDVRSYLAKMRSTVADAARAAKKGSVWVESAK